MSKDRDVTKRVKLESVATLAVTIELIRGTILAGCKDGTLGNKERSSAEISNIVFSSVNSHIKGRH